MVRSWGTETLVKLKLKTKYSLVILGLVLSLALLMGTNMYFQSRSTLAGVIASGTSAMEKQLLSQLKVRARLFAVYLASNLVNALYFLDLESIQFTLAPAMEQEDISHIIVFDAQGRIVHDSWGENRVHEKALHDLVVRGSFSEQSVKMIREGESFKIVAPIKLEDEYLGGLVMSYSLAGLTRQTKEMRLKLRDVEEQGFQKNLFSFLILVSAFSLLAVIAAIRVAGGLAHPITQLSQWAKKIGRREKGVNISIDRTDERGELAESFRKMHEDLEQTTVSKSHVDDIIRYMQNSLIVVSPEGNIEMFNWATLDLLGHREDELTGGHARIIFHDADTFEQVIMKKLDQQGKLLNLEQAYRHADGRSIPVLFSGSSLRNVDNEIEGYVFVATDLTERIRAEQKLNQYAKELERSNKELEDFAFIASHDLQEPIRKIAVFGERLKESSANKLEEKELSYLGRMESAALRMQVFIEDLLCYARVTTKARAFQKIDLSRVVNEVISVFELKLEHLNAVVDVGDLPSLEADRTQMHQLFQNLFSNALKFRRQEETLNIKISSKKLENGQFEIHVKDNGIGFDEKYLDKIFKPFERLHGRSAYEGSGMGLALCRKIAQWHGGSLLAKSREGQGAVFIVTLPEYFPGHEDNADSDLNR